ncbi:MAG: Molybdopterin-guanine dinucleotide biosynthesis protein [Gemmatimonadetes bacterium]|nr:Molybdopterin-guanine dinucleotide biosynthesis protein [Gemmatimonadota bacterium]
MSAQTCVGVLLAGGAARRFDGAPKGLARIEGVPIADRALAALAEATDLQVVAINDPRGDAWFPGFRLVADREPGLGPLAGLVTALRAGEGASVLVVAWDMPFIPGALLRSLRQRGEAALASGVPVHGAASTAEPLCAYYRPECLGIAERLLATGERRARALYEALMAVGAAVTMGDRELARFGDPAHLFTSVDTPAALALLGGEAPAATRR